jgi:hypothetical protein
LLLATPSTFTRPARMCAMIGAIELNIMFMCPASTSVTACGAPLYGTCVISTPAICLKSSIARWLGTPLPAEA